MTPIEKARKALQDISDAAVDGTLGNYAAHHQLSECDRIAREALATLTRIEEGWQPIATAPKDGTTIIGWGEYCLEPVTVRWNRDEWQSVWARSEVISSQSDFGTDYEKPDPLTHWRPLPAPPEPVMTCPDPKLVEAALEKFGDALLASTSKYVAMEAVVSIIERATLERAAQKADTDFSHAIASYIRSLIPSPQTQGGG